MAARDDAEARDLARFACDHCRRKKLKCSRELPKCRACQPWSSVCEYTRDAEPQRPRKARKRSRSSSPPHAETTNGAALDLRLRSDDTVTAAFVFPEQRSAAGGDASEDQTSPARLPSNERTSVAAHRGRGFNRADLEARSSEYTSSFSFLRDAADDMGRAESLAGSLAHEEARSHLQTLQRALAIESTSADTQNALRKQPTAYNVPSRSLGYAYISQFFAASSMGSIFLQEPTDECIRHVIFEPERVSAKAWVVYINYMLLGMISTNRNRTVEADALRTNVHLALNDSSIFLFPSVVNVQALATLSIHGEDFASPSQSWMLVGHACRQSEALALHLPASASSDIEQRRLCLFWLLFVIDKGCSLAFGRPPTLTTTTYGGVAFPDYGYLARHSPHLSETFTSGRDPKKTSDFGALFYLEGFELAKLIGLVLESRPGRKGHHSRQTLRQRLEGWYISMNARLSAALNVESASNTPAQNHEMGLGISSFKFQYLHLLIVLLRDDAGQRVLRLDSAREALAILPQLVSNWGSVYNGIMWQLLYLPFGPFFVIFGNLLADPKAHSVTQDFDHLQSVVRYFESMREQLSLLATLAGRLARTAAVFVHLARNFVYQAGAAPAESTHNLDSMPELDIETLNRYLEWLPESLPPIRGPQRGASVDGNPEMGTFVSNHARSIDVFDWFSWDTYCEGTTK